MSYTLYLWAQDGSALDCERLVELFGTDCFADLDVVGEEESDIAQELFYENQQTDVYFQIGNANPDDEEVDEASVQLKQIGFCVDVNLARPAVFALETAEFLDALHEEIPLLCWDTQLDDSKVVPYDREVFLANWMLVNHSSYNAISSLDPNFKDRPILASSEMLRFWNWNYFRPQLDDEIKEDVYVPRFYLAKIGAEVHCVPMWPNKLPVCLPDAEWILLNRSDELLSESARQNDEEIEFTLVSRKDLEKLLAPFETRQFRGVSYRFLNYDSPESAPQAIDELFRSRHFESNFDVCALDGVLDGTFFEEHTAKAH
jgi:hypothetical protein